MNGSPLVIDRAEQDDRAEFKDAVLAGLEGTPRAIPAKFLYDARGSALFDAICELPEYYLTRTETDILRRSAADIAMMAGPGCALVEYGSGADVETVIVDGEVVVEKGRSTRINDEELFAQAQAGANRAWDNWAGRDWAGRTVEQINPPAFPTRKGS